MILGTLLPTCRRNLRTVYWLQILGKQKYNTSLPLQILNSPSSLSIWVRSKGRTVNDMVSQLLTVKAPNYSSTEFVLWQMKVYQWMSYCVECMYAWHIIPYFCPQIINIFKRLLVFFSNENLRRKINYSSTEFVFWQMKVYQWMSYCVECMYAWHIIPYFCSQIFNIFKKLVFFFSSENLRQKIKPSAYLHPYLSKNFLLVSEKRRRL